MTPQRKELAVEILKEIAAEASAHHAFIARVVRVVLEFVELAL